MAQSTASHKTKITTEFCASHYQRQRVHVSRSVVCDVSSEQGSYRKTFQNPQTFSHLQNPSMMPKYGAEKQHEGTQLFSTFSKRAQPLLYPMADALCQSKLIGSAFFVTLHNFKNIFFNNCSVLGNAVSE